MRNLGILFLVGFAIFQQSLAQTSESLVLIGLIPGRYFERQNPEKTVLGYIEIQHRVIQKMGLLKENEVERFKRLSLAKDPTKKIMILKSEQSDKFDIIYPGLINLHNHTKHNNLPIWSEAVGQFANRFEWRDWPSYNYAVKGNINPWPDYAKVVECSTYRWSELLAMIQGTLYLQGPSSCVNDFGIQRVEEATSYVSAKANVQAPTDLISPDDMHFFWKILKPLIQSGKSYEQAISEVIKANCPALSVTAENVNNSEMLKIFKDQAKLIESCNKENLPDKFIRYVYWVHPSLAGRKNYFNSKVLPPAAIIAHLAEGRRDDDYNKKEFEIVKLLGLAVPQMNFVHGVGIPSTEFKMLADKKIGLIWSPFSNLLLYSQTLDIAAAFQAGVRIAIGSDWVPTGTKSVLEEVKIARKYILKDYDKENLVSILSSGTGKVSKIDEELYKMITENPAKMIGHYDIVKAPVTAENPSGYKEAAVGTLSPGAMGSVIVVRQQVDNPYTNLIQHSSEKDIHLVIVDGRPIYGNKSYIDKYKPNTAYEIMPNFAEDFSTLADFKEGVSPKENTPESKLDHVVQTMNYFSKNSFVKKINVSLLNQKFMFIIIQFNWMKI